MWLGIILDIFPIILQGHGHLIVVVPNHNLGLDGIHQLSGGNMVIVSKDIPVSVPDVRCKFLEDFL